VKIGYNLAETSKEGYGSKRTVLLMMVMMIWLHDHRQHQGNAENSVGRYLKAFELTDL
jgi:hypothetical protein